MISRCITPKQSLGQNGEFASTEFPYSVTKNGFPHNVYAQKTYPSNSPHSDVLLKPGVHLSNPWLV